MSGGGGNHRRAERRLGLCMHDRRVIGRTIFVSSGLQTTAAPPQEQERRCGRGASKDCQKQQRRGAIILPLLRRRSRIGRRSLSRLGRLGRDRELGGGGRRRRGFTRRRRFRDAGVCRRRGKRGRSAPRRDRSQWSGRTRASSRAVGGARPCCRNLIGGGLRGRVGRFRCLDRRHIDDRRRFRVRLGSYGRSRGRGYFDGRGDGCRRLRLRFLGKRRAQRESGGHRQKAGGKAELASWVHNRITMNFAAVRAPSAVPTALKCFAAAPR